MPLNCFGHKVNVNDFVSWYNVLNDGKKEKSTKKQTKQKKKTITTKDKQTNKTNKQTNKQKKN